MGYEKPDSYKKYINELGNEYKTAFEKIEVYINGSSKLNPSEKNNCFLEILDTFLSGQKEEKPLKEITGSDLKKYCDDMIYGETAYIYKASRIFTTIIRALFYVTYMQFFIRLFNALSLKKDSLIFQPMNFGIGDLVLILGYICIPQLISPITRDYFANPMRCKKVKRYTYYGVWLFTIAIYTFAKDIFGKYGLVISFSNVVLILISLIVISSVVWVSMNILDKRKSENKKSENKYIEKLNEKYNTYVDRCKRRSKIPLNWNEFIKNRIKSNSIYLKVFMIYSLIFLVLAILIVKEMLTDRRIDTAGIILLMVVSLFDVLIVLFVKIGIQINKKLSELKP